MGMGSSFMGFMGIGTWIFVIAVFALIIWGLTAGLRSNNSDVHDNSPQTILKRRLASGEITQEDYRRLLTELHR